MTTFTLVSFINQPRGQLIKDVLVAYTRLQKLFQFSKLFFSIRFLVNANENCKIKKTQIQNLKVQEIARFRCKDWRNCFFFVNSQFFKDHRGQEWRQVLMWEESEGGDDLHGDMGDSFTRAASYDIFISQKRFSRINTNRSIRVLRMSMRKREIWERER